MVNVPSLARQEAQAAATVRARGAAYRARVLAAAPPAFAAYGEFCAQTVHSPTQGPLWARAWLEGRGAEGLIVLLFRDGRPALGLALEVVRHGPVHIARFAGGSHANGNFPALGADTGEAGAAMAALTAAIRAERPDIDMLALERQRRSFEGLANPTLALPHTTSPNIALSADLSGGFEQALEWGGKRKRKKHRARARKFEQAGGYRLVEARTPAEVDALLDAFFEMKHARFVEWGLPDVFAPPQVQARLRALFHAALDADRPAFVLHGLEVGGRLRAVTGSSRTRDSIICEFNAFARDELANHSPGEFLFHENVQAACAEGLAVYDFSVGDEPYKRLWCNIETQHADVFAGLSRRGSLLAAGWRMLARLKRRAKQHPAAARLARRARKMLGG